MASVSTNTLDHCGWEFDPSALKGVLAAQMNLRYGLAVMALDGVATPAQYTEARIKSPDIAAFLPKIDVCVRDEFDKDGSLRLACALEVRSRAGKAYVERTLYRPGSAEDPVSPQELVQKFTTLTMGIVSAEQALRCRSHIERLEAQVRVRLLG